MASEQFDQQPPEYLEPPTSEIINLQRKCLEATQEQLAQEYHHLRNETILGQGWTEKFRESPKEFQKCFSGSSNNPQRNRYTDVPSFEETRVRIKFEKVAAAAVAKPEYRLILQRCHERSENKLFRGGSRLIISFFGYRLVQKYEKIGIFDHISPKI